MRQVEQVVEVVVVGAHEASHRYFQSSNSLPYRTVSS